jgi:XRE family transcriptional regulator, regulator of sulfur utilization
MLSGMPKAKLPTGRPHGSTSFEPVCAAAFGKALRQARIASGVSQDKLALAAQLERAHIGRMERGENIPNLWVVLKLCEALGQSPSALLEPTLKQIRKAKESPLASVLRVSSD